MDKSDSVLLLAVIVEYAAHFAPQMTVGQCDKVRRLERVREGYMQMVNEQINDATWFGILEGACAQIRVETGIGTPAA